MVLEFMLGLWPLGNRVVGLGEVVDEVGGGFGVVSAEDDVVWVLAGLVERGGDGDRLRFRSEEVRAWGLAGMWWT